MQDDSLINNQLIYFIAFTIRSGSNYLSSLLENNGFGKPREYFQNIDGKFKPVLCQRLGLLPDTDSYDYFTNLLSKQSVNGIFGAKFAPRQYRFMLSKYQELSELQASLLFNIATFKKWIWLKRNDKIAQAISSFRANNSGQWRSNQKVIGNIFPEYNFQKIRKEIDRFTTQDSWWENFWRDNNITPYTIVYEEFIQKPAWFISDISKYICLGTNIKPLEEEDIVLKSPLKIQRDKYSEYLREKFVKDLEAICESIH